MGSDGTLVVGVCVEWDVKWLIVFDLCRSELRCFVLSVGLEGGDSAPVLITGDGELLLPDLCDPEGDLLAVTLWDKGVKSLLLAATFLLLLTGVLLSEALLLSLPGLPVGVDSTDRTCLLHFDGRALDCCGPVCMVHVKFGLPHTSF